MPNRHLSQLLPSSYAVCSSTTWFNRLSPAKNWQAKVNMLSHPRPLPPTSFPETRSDPTHIISLHQVWLFGKKLNKLNIKLHSGAVSPYPSSVLFRTQNLVLARYFCRRNFTAPLTHTHTHNNMFLCCLVSFVLVAGWLFGCFEELSSSQLGCHRQALSSRSGTMSWKLRHSGCGLDWMSKKCPNEWNCLSCLSRFICLG